MIDDIYKTPIWVCKNHKVTNFCECGMNNGCYACGLGAGVSPCDCTPLPKIEFLVKQAQVIIDNGITDGL